MSALKEKVLRLIALLDEEEQSDGGRVFHPTSIVSCRAHIITELNTLLEEIKDLCSN